MGLESGQRAPDFTLKATTGDSISLAQYRGERPVILLFFPLAFSPVCTNELTIMRDAYESYAAAGVAVIASSVDSPFTLQAWAERLELPFPLLSDFNKETARDYQAFHEDLMGLRGVSKRAAFVIDKEGVVRYNWVSEDPGQLPNFDEMHEAAERAAAA